MDYLTLEFPYTPAPDCRQAAADAVLSGTALLAASLGAYRFGRRAEIRPEELRIDPAEVEWAGAGEGMLKLRFAETEFQACRYEQTTVPHEALMRFHVEEGRLFLKFLAPPTENRMEGF